MKKLFVLSLVALITIGVMVVAAPSSSLINDGNAVDSISINMKVDPWAIIELPIDAFLDINLTEPDNNNPRARVKNIKVSANTNFDMYIHETITDDIRDTLELSNKDIWNGRNNNYIVSPNIIIENAPAEFGDAKPNVGWGKDLDINKNRYLNVRNVEGGKKYNFDLLFEARWNTPETSRAWYELLAGDYTGKVFITIAEH